MNVYTFNASGNMVKKEEKTNGLRLSDPASFVTTYAYNADMLKTSETFSKGNGLKYTYDTLNPNPRARGNLVQIRKKTSMAAADNDLNDIVTGMSYEPLFNQIKSITDPKGNVTTRVYDYELTTTHPKYNTVGNLIFIDQPAVSLGTSITEFAYNTFGQATETLDPNGNKTQYSYDPITGYLTDINQDPTGINAQTHFTYDTNGNPDHVVDANNHTTDYDYDALGWLNKVTNPLGYITKYTHDANGNVIKTERQADELATTWQTTQYTYDILNKLKTVTDPLNRVTIYNYDANENKTNVIDANGNTTTSVYDERNLLLSATDANTPAGITTYDYDLNGNQAKITDANGNPTNYTYDLFDRLDITQYANLSQENLDYDKNSNLTRRTTPSGKLIEYDYDALNRLIANRYPFNASLNTSYAYDLGGRTTDANNSASLIHNTYDNLNREAITTQTINSSPYTLNYAYDKSGNRTQLVYPSGKTLDHVYAPNNRFLSIKHLGSSIANYTYDPLDRRIQESLVTDNLPLTTYAYDLANQLTSITNTLVNGTPISQYSYPLYDNAGNRKQLDKTLGTNSTETINYGYNNIYELTSVTGAQTNSYDYDKVGNRNTADVTIYTANNLNQYTNVGGTTHLYDANGNLASDGSKTYTYDEQNRLSSMVNGPLSASYAYDALNRRISKIVNGVTTYFIYDDDSIVAEYDGTGALNAEYILGDNIDEVLAMEQGGNTYYYHYDGLGSVTEITDEIGTLVENYIYDPYGNLSIVNSTIGNRYRFTGREFDEESGIYHYRARAYDSMIGRFLQRDPVGYFDSMNLFAYTHNNPVNFIDPLGLGAVKDAVKKELDKEFGDKLPPEIKDKMATVFENEARTLGIEDDLIKNQINPFRSKQQKDEIQNKLRKLVEESLRKRAEIDKELQKLQKSLDELQQKIKKEEPCPTK